MKKLIAGITIGIGVLVAAPLSLSAHHSQARYTNADGAIQISGTVVKIELTNPHSFLYIDEVDKDGKPVMKDGKKKTWALEMQSLRGLAMNGWADDTVKVGQKVTVIGRPARNGAPAMYCEVVTLPDGRQMRS